MSYPEATNINKEAEAVMAQDPMSHGKLLLLGLLALALCSFGPMSFFASVPLAMSILIFGRMKTFAMFGVITIALLMV